MAFGIMVDPGQPFPTHTHDQNWAIPTAKNMQCQLDQHNWMTQQTTMLEQPTVETKELLNEVSVLEPPTMSSVLNLQNIAILIYSSLQQGQSAFK